MSTVTPRIDGNVSHHQGSVGGTAAVRQALVVIEPMLEYFLKGALSLSRLGFSLDRQGTAQRDRKYYHNRQSRLREFGRG